MKASTTSSFWFSHPLHPREKSFAFKISPRGIYPTAPEPGPLPHTLLEKQPFWASTPKPSVGPSVDPMSNPRGFGRLRRRGLDDALLAFAALHGLAGARKEARTNEGRGALGPVELGSKGF